MAHAGDPALRLLVRLPLVADDGSERDEHERDDEAAERRRSRAAGRSPDRKNGISASAAHEDDRDERDDRGEGREHDRERDVGRAAQRRLHRLQSLLALLLDALDDDDRVVDEHPDRDRHADHREQVEACRRSPRSRRPVRRRLSGIASMISAREAHAAEEEEQHEQREPAALDRGLAEVFEARRHDRADVAEVDEEERDSRAPSAGDRA